MKTRISLFALMFVLSGPTFAQVYKSTDADGNVTFSDTPTSENEEVQVDEANVADPVEVPENTSPPPAPEPKVIKTERPAEVVVETESDDGGRYNPVVRHRVIHRHQRREHRRR